MDGREVQRLFRMARRDSEQEETMTAKRRQQYQEIAVALVLGTMFAAGALCLILPVMSLVL
jgi:hypothetical protein